MMSEFVELNMNSTFCESDKFDVFPCGSLVIGCSSDHCLYCGMFVVLMWLSLCEQVSRLYAKEYPECNYFDDLISAHRNLGLAQAVGDAWILASLIPYCGYDFKVISWNLDENFKLALHKAVDSLLHQFGSKTFNFCIQLPPLQDGKVRAPCKVSPAGQRLDKRNTAMPFIAHLIDRGDVTTGTSSDICGMRIFGSAIVNEDPFALAQELGWSKWSEIQCWNRKSPSTVCLEIMFRDFK